jgi:hypothetical protein
MIAVNELVDCRPRKSLLNQIANLISRIESVKTCSNLGCCRLGNDPSAQVDDVYCVKFGEGCMADFKNIPFRKEFADRCQNFAFV